MERPPILKTYACHSADDCTKGNPDFDGCCYREQVAEDLPTGTDLGSLAETWKDSDIVGGPGPVKGAYWQECVPKALVEALGTNVDRDGATVTQTQYENELAYQKLYPDYQFEDKDGAKKGPFKTPEEYHAAAGLVTAT
jgi:hypothetical protein